MKKYMWPFCAILLAGLLLPSPNASATGPQPYLSISVEKSTLWPPNHKMVNVGLNVKSKGVTLDKVHVYSNEPEEDQTGDGHFSPDASFDNTDCTYTFKLRSERKGNSGGRVYLIVATGYDKNGKEYFGATTVVVTHSQNGRAKDSVADQAASAIAYVLKNHAIPPSFREIGFGPVIGPKQ